MNETTPESESASAVPVMSEDEAKKRLNRVVDLDAARVSRQENQGQAPKVIHGGQEFELPMEISADVFDSLEGIEENMGQVKELLEVMIGADTFAAMKAARPMSFDDIVVMIEGVADIYGISLGELPASSS